MPGLRLGVTISPPDRAGARTANFGVSTNLVESVSSVQPLAASLGAGTPVLASEQSVDVRILVDRSVVEYFAAAGRWTTVNRAFPPRGQTGVVFDSDRDVAVTVGAYEMGCGWV